jgi:hypothetical protein
VTRTYADACILIRAFRGEDDEKSLQAIALLGDANREFAASIFLEMETLAKAQFNRRPLEVAFYEAFFENAAVWAGVDEDLVTAARDECSLCGLNALDSLHVAAAHATGCAELVTCENPDRSIYRARSILVRTAAAATSIP